MSRPFWAPVATLALATFAASTEAFVYVGLLGPLARDLDVDLATAGLLPAGFALTYALTAPFLAALTGHWRRRSVLVTGLSAVGILNLASAFAPTFAWLLASRILVGLIAALVGPSATAAASRLAPPELRGRAMALVGAGTGLAFTLGVPLGSMIGEAWGWRATFVFAGLLLLLCSTVLRLILPNIDGSDRAGLQTLRIALEPATRVWLGRTVWAFTATFCSVAYLGPIAQRVAGGQGISVGAFQACIGVGSILGILWGGRLADRKRASRTIARLMALVGLMQLGIVGAHLCVGAAGSVSLAFSLLVGALVLFAMMPTIQLALIELAPEARTTVIAMNGTMVFLGQGLGALAGSLSIRGFGLIGVGVLGGLIAAMYLCMATFSRRSSSDVPPTEAWYAAEECLRSRGSNAPTRD